MTHSSCILNLSVWMTFFFPYTLCEWRQLGRIRLLLFDAVLCEWWYSVQCRTSSEWWRHLIQCMQLVSLLPHKLICSDDFLDDFLNGRMTIFATYFKGCHFAALTLVVSKHGSRHWLNQHSVSNGWRHSHIILVTQRLSKFSYWWGNWSCRIMM